MKAVRANITAYNSASSTDSKLHPVWHQHAAQQHTTSIKRSKSESDLASLRRECTCRLNDSDNQATEECLKLMEETVLSMDDGRGDNEECYDSEQEDYGPDAEEDYYWT